MRLQRGWQMLVLRARDACDTSVLLAAHTTQLTLDDAVWGRLVPPALSAQKNPTVCPPVWKVAISVPLGTQQLMLSPFSMDTAVLLHRRLPLMTVVLLRLPPTVVLLPAIHLGP